MSAYLSNAAVEAILGYLRDESLARDLSARIKSLAAENASLLAEAARYHYLRDHTGNDIMRALTSPPAPAKKEASND